MVKEWGRKIIKGYRDIAREGREGEGRVKIGGVREQKDQRHERGKSDRVVKYIHVRVTLSFLCFRSGQ